MPRLRYKKTTPQVHKSAYIANTASLIGDVVVGAQSSLWFGVVARGDINLIRIGQRTNIQDGTIIHVSAPGNGTHIGDDVTVGHMAVLHDCTLQDGSFVGIKACVMDGAVVESGAMVAAGALVTPRKVVRSGELWSGVPAKPARALKQEEVDMIRWIPEHYVELQQEYLRQARINQPRSNK
jgi:carbonic anhydrase/acetyltransferase-like protein (isoleucine patch superfamily)